MIKSLAHILMLTIILISCKDSSDDRLIELHHNKEIKHFPDVEEFYFVGATELNPGVYVHNLKSGKSKIFWNSRTETVIDFASDSYFKTAFFITAIRYGIAGSFPFVEKARLYRIDPEKRKAEFLKDIGNVIQIYSYWTDEGNFNLTINTFDPKVNTYVIQTKQVYNQFGRLLSDLSETSDLMISGYPVIKLKDLRTTSYDERFRLFNVSDSVFIRDTRTKEKIFVQQSNQKLTEIEWVMDKSLVIFSSVKPSQENVRTDFSASLNIFDFNKKEIIKTHLSSSLYRFAVTNDFLIFETGFQSNSKIHIIRLPGLEQYQIINIKGGCGLRGIPQNPYL